MGVKRFHRVLQDEGWLPDHSATPCCSTSLWRNATLMHDCPAFAANVSLVQRRSTLIIDGAGLAFYLYRVAYARRITEVLICSSSTNGDHHHNGGRSSSRRSSCPCAIKNVKPQHATKLLPNLLPLTLLDEVTREFVDTLQKKHHMKLIVYFDGELRREAKRETDEKRQEKRPVEWSALQQYCCNGIMPQVDKVCQWEELFPKNRLFIAQVKHSLGLCQVPIKYSREEADAEIARFSLKTPNSYVVGNDTDFCFFPKIRYIPLSTLHAEGSVVTASVITRKSLATSLHLPDEAAMVELAILMGNDYVGGNNTRDVLDFEAPFARDIMHHLRANGEGYRVSSLSGEETAKAIEFARAFYALKNLDELDNTSALFSPRARADDNDNKEEEEISEEPELDALAMKIPRDFPSHLAMVQPHDLSLGGAVLRCLQAYVDQASNDGNNNDTAIIQQKHLDAMKLLALYHQNDNSVAWRPQWEDMTACFVIESCIAYVSKKSANSPVVRLSPPSKIFDAYKFHQALFKLRSPAEEPTTNMPPVQQITLMEDQSVSSTPTMEPRVVLPIDEHEESILDAINRNRVTIIQGETGCGKSSRVPIMIMNAPVPDPELSEIKLFISQPRRIAAKALVERLRSTEPELGRKVALRMGHGVREYESSATRAWFVTTGYLVRLLSNHPEKFNDVSHLIIDEIHERGVDTDILCLLCRRLLHSNPHIRLVLMSATLAAGLYQEYFGISEPTIKVGARRFPIEEVFVEDIPNKLRLPPKEIKAVRQIVSECQKTRCIAAPSNNTMEGLYSLAARIAITVGQPGSSVLIFVPGMRDIEGISEIIEKMYVPGVTYTCIPVHSDIPFEDQMMAFEESDEVKIIVATNAAESSITLPDCDHVICTGLQKQITYNASSHRQMLTPTWISRASAQQRSGRVGRVRPGTVYRLYTREAYETMMKQFESGEMLRMPLDSVILMLKEVLNNENTSAALLDCLEPPDLSTIERSYDSLYKANFISQPGDSGEITHLGAFVSALGIDLSLGALIGLGIQFGVGPEAIELAAVLSFPKTPWLVSNPLVHKPKSFNAGTAKAYCSKNQFDSGILSEPLATMNLIYEYSRLHGSKLSAFCNNNGVHSTRIRRLISTRNNLVGRVADFTEQDPSVLKLHEPVSKAPHAKLSLLRILQVWVFNESLIEFNPLPITSNPDGSFSLALKGGKDLEQAHLSTVLRSDRHAFTLKTYAEIEQTGSFNSGDGAIDLESFFVGFEERFVSYAIQRGLDLAWAWFEQGLQLYVCSDFYDTDSFKIIRKQWDGIADESVLLFIESPLSNRRGRKERDCGRWSLIQDPLDDAVETASQLLQVKKFALRGSRSGATINSKILAHLRVNANIKGALAFDFSKNQGQGKKKNRGTAVFQIACCGTDAFKVSGVDLCDLLSIARSDGNYRLLDKREAYRKSIVFDNTNDGPALADLSSSGSGERENAESRPPIKEPLLHNAPEGARLLTVIAASRRREPFIFIPLASEDPEDEEEFITFALDNSLSRLQSRWTRIGTSSTVYVTENSVPASVIPVEPIGHLYACCANTLDLRGGGMRAENLTLLPPGGLFILLSLLTFGLAPDGLVFPKDDNDLDVFIYDCIAWARARDVDPSAEDTSRETKWDAKVRQAIQFCRSCDDLGEQLICFPDKVGVLCQIFDGVDGYKVEIWSELDSDPFIPLTANERKQRDLMLTGLQNPGEAHGRMESAASLSETNRPVAVGLAQHLLDVTADTNTPDEVEQKEPATETNRPVGVGLAQHLLEVTADTNPPEGEEEQKEPANETNRPVAVGLAQHLLEVTADANPPEDEEEKKEPAKDKPLRGEEVLEFNERLVAATHTMFAAEMPFVGVARFDDVLPSTNILSIFLKQFYLGLVYEAFMQADQREELLSAVERLSVMKLTRDHWEVYRFAIRDGTDWYQAVFVGKSLPMKGQSNTHVNWYRFSRPWTEAAALECIPSRFRNVEMLQMEIDHPEGGNNANKGRRAVLFRSIEDALRMEAAFYLELNFGTNEKRWYEQSFKELAEQLTRRIPSTPADILRRLNAK